MRKNREDQVTVRANFLEVERLHTFFWGGRLAPTNNYLFLSCNLTEGEFSLKSSSGHTERRSFRLEANVIA